MLSKSRIVSVGETPYAHEREGIAFAEKALPDVDPYHLWALVDLLDPSTGRLHELDLVVLGYSCLYLVELKSYPGRIEGDAVDWIWVTPEGRRNWRDNPRGLARRKAQILKSRLERVLPSSVRAPWVEPLIFLSDPDVKLGLTREGLIGVVRRDNFADAITRHEYPGADPRQQGKPIDRVTARAVVQALSSIGFKPRKGKLRVGSYELGALLDETQAFQDREAAHSTIPAQRRRARTYLVPDQTSIERRQQLLRAAEREAQLLHEVREHPNILTLTDYVPDAPLGPTVLLDDFDRGVPLDVFLRLEPALPFGERIEILKQLASALGHCHRREIVHGGLCPSAVLVRHTAGAIETRLCNFQLGGSQSVEATSHWSALGPEAWAIYQAPELRRDPTQRTVEADLFSLGAIGYLLLTGRSPGATVAEVEQRMEAARCLDPRDASDGVPVALAEAIASATAEVVATRFNDVTEWIELVLDAATAPPATVVPEIDPLDARKDDLLGEYRVVRVLGHGASSRVLEVERDGQSHALKVSIGPAHDERIEAEAVVLGKLHHSRIVRLEERLVFGGRPCLLMSLAGQSLQRVLAEDGTPSLDYANRYGADLLGALAHLEEREIIHRDIKPANVGVGSVGKKSQGLVLFDFSLASVPLDDIGVGTSAYRDPQLVERKHWDSAADRYSAAVTLHEVVTGQRPQISATSVILAAERIDPSVRAPLVAFFQRAFSIAVKDRHDSAEAMRREWERAFETPVTVAADEPVPTATDEQIAAIAPSTPIQALPLSNRAKNALDRAGFLCVGDLRDLPQNRLSAIPGVGRQVAKSILELRERWLRLAPGGPITSEPAFFPNYRGADLMLRVAMTEASGSVIEILADAGLHTSSALASAPKTQIRALATRHGFDAAVLAAMLTREQAAVQARDRPNTIEAWLDALLPAGKKKFAHVRALYGLGEHAYDSVRELATALGMTTAAIYIAVGKARGDWADHPAIGELTAEVRALVTRDGALPLASAATELLARIAHVDDDGAARRAIALIRVVAELDREQVDGLRFVRLRSGAPWLLRTEELEAQLETLGEIADELAGRSVLAGPAETHRALVDAGGAFAELPSDRLVRIAAAASRQAAASSRLEIYPRGMDARRALDLCTPILPAQVGEAKLRELVSSRYADAAPLPARPALDALLHDVGLDYQPALALYARGSIDLRASLHTSVSSYTRLAAPVGRDLDPEDVAIQEFDDIVRACLERRSLLVLGVSAERSQDAARALAERFGLQPRSFDQLFLAELERQMTAGGVAESVVYDTDAKGVAADAWPNLLALARRTAKGIAATLLPPKQPLLLVHPGLIDRYALTEFLRTLVDAAKRDEAEAILVLVPGVKAGVPRIGSTAIPDLLPGQWRWIPRVWIRGQLERVS